MHMGNKLYVPLMIDGKKYYITVEREDCHPHETIYWSYGEEYTNPMESPCAFGDTPEQAILKFLLAKNGLKPL